MFSIPYNTDFNYMNLKEVQNILEDTITLIFNALNFGIFHQLSLCELECDSNGIFSFEIELRDSVIVFDENTIDRFIRRLNHRFSHYQQKCREKYNELLNNYYYATQQFYYEIQCFGASNITPEKEQLNYINYCKKWQYFLYADIIFLSCTKASYDRNGRTCTVYFKIVY